MNRDPFASLRRQEKFDQQVVFRSPSSVKAEFEGICRKHRLAPGSVHRCLLERFNEQYREEGPNGLLRLLLPSGKRRGK